MCLVVGHNDAGYEPDVDPVLAPDLNTAIRTLKQTIWDYFQIEVDEIELTLKDVREFQHRAFNATIGSTLVFHGHTFWIRHDNPNQS